MGDEEYEDNKKIPYNSAGDIAQNITTYFRLATNAMLKRDNYSWYIWLEAANLEAQYLFKPDERNNLNEIWKTINPYLTSSYHKLKEYHAKLRDFCYKYGFFTMVGDTTNPRKAVYPGGGR